MRCLPHAASEDGHKIYHVNDIDLIVYMSIDKSGSVYDKVQYTLPLIFIAVIFVLSIVRPNRRMQSANKHVPPAVCRLMVWALRVKWISSGIRGSGR